MAPRTAEITAAAARSARRFPLVLLAGAAAAITAILLVESQDLAWLGRTLAAATLGLSLLVASRLAGERVGGRQGWVADAVGMAVLVLVWWRWPAWSGEVRGFRYAQLSVASHLAVAVAPFVGRPLHNAFWQFNRALFERILTSIAYTVTLFLGLALALGAVDVLLGADVADTAYVRLWLVLGFVFNTWMFVGGVPASPQGLEAVDDYPKSLRVFAQWVLVPLVSIYYLIFTLYVIRVLATWDWPSGWTGYLVSAMAAVGMLALLLVAPVAERPDQGWVRAFSRWFWLAMLPAVAVLWLAIGQRVQQYGVTEPRYFLIVLSLWLAGVAVFYGATRSRDYRVIPLSLAVLALVSMAGPWGAFRVSESSQVRRLTGLLTAAGILVDDQIMPGAAMAPEERTEVAAIVRYLVDRHGTGQLSAWIPDALVTGPASGRDDRRAAAMDVVRALGVPDAPSGTRDRRVFVFGGGVVDIAGWRRLVRVNRARDTMGDLTVVTNTGARSVRVLRGDVNVLQFDLRGVVDSLWAGRDEPRRDDLGPMRVSGQGPGGSGLLVITSLTIVADARGLRLASVDAYLLLN